MLQKWPVYPFLLAIWPPLALAAKNSIAISIVPDLLPAAGTGLLVGVAVYTLVRRISRDNDVAAAATCSLVLGFWCFRWLDWQMESSTFIHDIGLDRYSGFLVSTIVLGGAYLAGMRVAPRLRSRRGTINAFALVLTALPVATLVITGTRPSIAAQIGPRPEARVDAESLERPDTYIIVLDGYAGRSALRDGHGFDNSEFIEALKRRGFRVPQSSRANYPWSPLALASMLNWEYLPDIPALAPQWPPGDLSDLHASIAGNATFRTLITRGYHFRFVPSPIWFASDNPWAHEISGTVRLPAGEFHKTWHSMTPLPEIRRLLCRYAGCASRQPWVPETVERFDQKFAAIGRPGPDSIPLFVFAHLMLPHEPYIFGADCTQSQAPLWPDPVRDLITPQIRGAYALQVACLNHRLLSLVDSILAWSESTPVIVLQSDHGQRYGLGKLPASVDDVEDWADIFAAYLLPKESLVVLPDSVTPVTAFREIFGRLGGERLDPLPDLTLISSPDSIFALKPWR